MKSFVWLIYLVGIIRGGEDTHKYSDGEHVILWMNTVGPYHNRQETYEYFSLPFCKENDLKKITKREIKIDLEKSFV